MTPNGPVRARFPIAVTGIGLLSPFGGGLDANWSALLDARSAVRRVSRFDASRFPCQVAAEVNFDLKPPKLLPDGYHWTSDRGIDFGLTAIEAALDDALIDPDEIGPRLGLVVATHGNAQTVQDILSRLEARTFDIDELSIAHSNRVLAAAYARGGPTLGIATACSSGAMALMEGARLIESGLCDVVIAGGTDAFVNEIQFSALCALQVLSTYNDEPARASRPFDRSRGGFVIGEGACFLVLEHPDHAAKRSARTHGLLTGWGAGLSLHHVTASCPDGRCQGETILTALAKAGRSPGDVDYVNAHGTGTADNDVAESKGIRYALGARADDIPVSSTKGATGHMIAAAGSAEAVFCLLAIRDRIVPPTLNLTHPGPGCDLDYVPLQARPWPAQIVVSNSFGLCGSMVSLVLEGAK
jgi:3-oxoacyl-[acyl-carrier-protein] synthase II